MVTRKRPTRANTDESLVLASAKFRGPGYNAKGDRVRRIYAVSLQRHVGKKSPWWSVVETGVAPPHDLIRWSFPTLREAQRRYDYTVAEWSWLYGTP